MMKECWELVTGRRYFFSNIKKTEEEILKKQNFFDKAWNFVDSDEGASALIHYFKNVKIDDPSIFKKRAPQTDDLKELIEQSKHPVIKKLEYDLKRPDKINTKIFKDYWPGYITFDYLNDQLHTTIWTQYQKRNLIGVVLVMMQSSNFYLLPVLDGTMEKTQDRLI